MLGRGRPACSTRPTRAGPRPSPPSRTEVLAAAEVGEKRRDAADAAWWRALRPRSYQNRADRSERDTIPLGPRPPHARPDRDVTARLGPREADGHALRGPGLRQHRRTPIGIAVGGIMAASITGTNTWSGVPIAVGALGTALASWPLARLMARSGRRPGLALGYGLAVDRRGARPGGRGRAELPADARRHGALRHREHVQSARPLRGRGREPRRPARPCDGTDRLGLHARLHHRPEPDGAGPAPRPTASACRGRRRAPSSISVGSLRARRASSSRLFLRPGPARHRPAAAGTGAAPGRGSRARARAAPRRHPAPSPRSRSRWAR